MPLALRADIVEGKTYRSKKKRDDDEENKAIIEIQGILARKNRRSCDCEAQLHDLLENCLNCGRLSCVEEGPGKCFTCGNIVLNSDQRNRFKKYIDMLQPDPSGSMYDNTDDGLKTRIIDHQYDQIAIQNKKHLRQEDRARMSQNLDNLQVQRHQRKLVLDLNIEEFEPGVTPIRSVPKVEDYSGELERLQLDDRSSCFESTDKLHDLVFKEYKINYEYAYVKSSYNQSRNVERNKKKTIN